MADAAIRVKIADAPQVVEMMDRAGDALRAAEAANKRLLAWLVFCALMAVTWMAAALWFALS